MVAKFQKKINIKFSQGHLYLKKIIFLKSFIKQRKCEEGKYLCLILISKKIILFNSFNLKWYQTKVTSKIKIIVQHSINLSREMLLHMHVEWTIFNSFAFFHLGLSEYVCDREHFFRRWMRRRNVLEWL